MINLRPKVDRVGRLDRLVSIIRDLQLAYLETNSAMNSMLTSRPLQMMKNLLGRKGW